MGSESSSRLTERECGIHVAVRAAFPEEGHYNWHDALAAYEWDPRLAQELGLLDEKGRDWFRGRVVFPEFRRGRAVYLVGRRVPQVTSFGPKYLFPRGLRKPLYGLERVEDAPDVFVVEGPIDWLILWEWGYPGVALLGNHVLPRRAETLEGRQVYLVPDRDDGGRTLWRDALRLFGPEMKTVVMPEGVKDVGELVERDARAREVFARLVDEAK